MAKDYAPDQSAVVSPSAAVRSAPRHVFFVLVFLMYVLAYGDRAALSIALPTMGHEFSLTPVAMGWISSSFLWSYLVLNLPSAMLVDRIGARLVGAISVTLWSLAMVLGGLSRTMPQFLITRVMLGVGESPTFGIGATVIRAWARDSERSLVMTFVTAGMQIGLAAGTIAGAYLIVTVGWRLEFVLLGLVGLFWTAAWWAIYRPPVKIAGRTRPDPLSFADVKALLGTRSYLGILIVQCTQNWLNFLLSAWLPIYLSYHQQLDLRSTAWRTAACYTAAALGAICLGRFLERVVFRRFTAPAQRRFVVTAAMFGSGLVGTLPFLHSNAAVLVMLPLSLCCVIAGSGANMSMLNQLVVDAHKIGSIAGLNLIFSNSLGLLAPIVTGYVVAYTGSFNAVWIGCGIALVVAGVASLVLVDGPIHSAQRAAPAAP